VSWAGQVDGAGSRWRWDPLEFGGLRKVRSTYPGPDLAPCNGVRLARPVYENTCCITRERLVRGIATRKGQASRGPCLGRVIRGHSAGRGVTRRSKTRTGFGHPDPTPARYGLAQWSVAVISRRAKMRADGLEGRRAKMNQMMMALYINWPSTFIPYYACAASEGTRPGPVLTIP
jgi:hypothetical protein